MPLFQPKHQKLIVQCYPAGRGPDKKPNSSELSYLLYYASTRRVKLEKVGRFMEKKNQNDISHARTGNVQVTLDIIDALIQKCPDDVNVFAENVISILRSVLTTGDLGLCQHAGPVFHTFSTALKEELITGDQEFVDNYTALTQGFLNLGIKTPAANPTEWKAIALKAATSFASSKFISMGKGKEVLSTAMPLVISEIQNDFTEETLLKKISSHSSEQQQLSRFNTAKSATAAPATNTAEPQSPMEINTDELAIEALRTFFHTTSATQLTTCTRSVATYLAKSGVNHDWAAAVTEMVANWIPVQLRFIVLTILIQQLKKDAVPTEQIVYLHVISRLLSSSVNLIGLSVIDDLRQLVDLQLHLLLTKSTSSQDLIRGYSDAIGSLATHVYYQDQIVDMTGELLVRLKECVAKPPKDFQPVAVVLLDNIKNVLTTAHEHATVQRSIVPLEIFSDTFSLLSYSKLSEEQNFVLQDKYIDLLITELQLEYTKDDYIQPDHNNLISGANVSVINQLYEQIEQCSKLPQGPVFDALLNLIELVAQKFGINAIANSIPFLFDWQLSGETRGDPELVMKDNLGYCILYFATKTLQYGELLDQTLARIDYRKSHGLWIVSNVVPAEKSTQREEFTLTKKQVQSFIQDGSLQAYSDTIFATHYRYGTVPVGVTESYEDAPDTSVMSHTDSKAGSFANLMQPTGMFANGDSHSIKSAPLSARSLIMGKLNVPKVQELRKAISGSALKVNGDLVSRQRTDARTLLQDLSLDDDLDDRGALTMRG